MMNTWWIVAACLASAACGLERTWDAFQRASEPDSETGSNSSTAEQPGDTDTSTTGSSAGESVASTWAVSGETSADATASSTGPADPGTTDQLSSTGEPGWCGDGVVDPGREQCDDGNDDETDRCTQDCRKIRLIFVTSLQLQGDINGLQSADAYCKSLALKAMMADPTSRIVDPGNFKALLATSTQTVFERHFHGDGPYQLVNGLRVSDSFGRLFSEPHANPVNVDERSMTQSAAVWTGMTADGSSFPGVDYCQDWTSIDGSTSYGDSDSVDGWWLFVDIAIDNPVDECGGEFALYCLEQE